MGLLDLFKPKIHRSGDLEGLERLVLGPAWASSSADPNESFLATSDALDPRDALYHLPSMTAAGMNAGFSEMADPKAVERFLIVIRDEERRSPPSRR